MSVRSARVLLRAGLAGLVAAVSACDRAPSADTLEKNTGEPGAGVVTLRIGGAADLRGALEKHRGKVVLVDFWATWCGPCVGQFPHTVALYRRHAQRGLAVISVSLDEPADREKVLKFLEKQGAHFDNLLSHLGVGAQAVEEFGLRGDVPLYRLYDRSGALRFQFSGEPEGLERGEGLDRMDDRVLELLDAK